jgi:single-strand DNA-binding protein
MYNGATVTLGGYVAREPILTMVNNTIPKAIVRVAWNWRYLDRVTGEWRDGKTSFANVNCWRKLAGNVAISLRKGQPVVVTGRLLVREYEDKEGRRRTVVDIEADAIGPDLTRGVSHFMRSRPEEIGGVGGGQPDGLAMGEAIRSGQADEDAPAGDAPDLEASGHEPSGLETSAHEPSRQGPSGLETPGQGPVDGQEAGDDVLNSDAVAELSAASSSAGAAAPF